MAKSSIEKELEALGIALELEEMINRAHEDALGNEEELEEEAARKNQLFIPQDQVDPLTKLGHELQEAIGNIFKVMETQKVKEATNKSLLESSQKKKTPATFPTTSPSASPAKPTDKLLTTNFMIVTPEPGSSKPSKN